jgi:Holliday junction resolvase Gen1 C-terminal domain
MTLSAVPPLLPTVPQYLPNNPDTNINDIHPLIVNISALTAARPQTDSLFEYRVELDPYQLVLRTQAGIEGTRKEPSEPSDGTVEEDDRQMYKLNIVDPFTPHRIWVPACMLQPVAEELVCAYEAEQETKSAALPCKSARSTPNPMMRGSLSLNVAPASMTKPRLKVRKGTLTLTGVQVPNDRSPVAQVFTLADAATLDAGGNCTMAMQHVSGAVSKAGRP